MTCTCRLQDLLTLLDTKAATTATIAADYRRVDRGLLSVGLKIHCLDEGRQFTELVEGLGGAAAVLEMNHYKDERASLCLVLPPVGSATSAIRLIESIEEYIGSPIFGNRQIQLQLCSPGRLNARSSALLGIGFYLGSDTLRRYTQADLTTTFASHFTYPRGIRLVLYDANGDFDRDFAWWNRGGCCQPELPFRGERTDLLIGSGSRLDIQNINLLATLLVHSEHDGYWHDVGEQFKVEMEELLDRHILNGLVMAPWVHESSARMGDDDRFFAALQELVAYAHGESARVNGTWRYIPARPPNGILAEMQTVLANYRSRLEKSPFVAQGEEPA